MRRKRTAAVIAALTAGSNASLLVAAANPADATQYPRRYDYVLYPSGDYGYTLLDGQSGQTQGHWWRQLPTSSGGEYYISQNSVQTTQNPGKGGFGQTLFDGAHNIYEGCQGPIGSSKGSYYQCDYLGTNAVSSPTGQAWATHPDNSKYYWSAFGGWSRNQGTVITCIDAIANRDSNSIAVDCFN